jgi:adenylylsulfate kinase-like enzyme
VPPPPSATPGDAAQKRQEQRLKSKKNLEFAHVYVMGMVEECTQREIEKLEIER